MQELQELLEDSPGRGTEEPPQKSKTWEGFNYSLNQEKYLKVFLDDGEAPKA